MRLDELECLGDLPGATGNEEMRLVLYRDSEVAFDCGRSA